MKYQRQEPPNAVQIELAEGCNLRCSFCGLNGIRGKDNDIKAMRPHTLKSVLEQIVAEGWNPRIEFAMHGEPTMHPDYHDMIAIARKAAPKLQLMMTSNGGGIIRKPGAAQNVRRLFEAGLNVLALDDYEGVKIVPKIRHDWGMWEMECHSSNTTTGVTVYEYPSNKDGNPHSRRKPGERALVFIQSIDVASKGTHATLNNHAGAGAPPHDSGMGKRCAKPFRELSVRWDGSVAVCCNDWRGVYKCGNVETDGLDAVWNGRAMGAARVMLYHGRREMPPCEGCDATSHRVGLLPDKLGKETMPAPDLSVKRDIAKATSGGTLTPAVLRPWEAET